MIDPELYQASLDSGLALVRVLACRRYSPSGYEFDDRISDGHFGLLSALRDYDPSLGKWETYAAHRIKYTIIDGHRSRHHLRRTVQEAETVSLNATHSDDLTILDAIADQSAPVDAAIIAAETGDYLWEAVDRIPRANWRYVLREYYQAARTFKDIGTSIGVSEARVAQIHWAAIKRLREVDFVIGGLQ
jgi:RNA polymerase sigma factor for flagellar operon FliA